MLRADAVGAGERPAPGREGTGARAGEDPPLPARHPGAGGPGRGGGAVGHPRGGTRHRVDRSRAGPHGRFADAEYGAELTAALAGWHLLPQRGGTFADRLANAHADTAAAFPGLPVLQIGMDTPQVRPALLTAALDAARRARRRVRAGADGGWWALGLREPTHASALRGVPMSTDETGRRTLAALRGHGVRPAILPVLRDVDDWPSALAVAADLPGTRFADAVMSVSGQLVSGRPR